MCDKHLWSIMKTSRFSTLVLPGPHDKTLERFGCLLIFISRLSRASLITTWNSIFVVVSGGFLPCSTFFKRAKSFPFQCLRSNSLSHEGKELRIPFIVAQGLTSLRFCLARCEMLFRQFEKHTGQKFHRQNVGTLLPLRCRQTVVVF